MKFKRLRRSLKKSLSLEIGAIDKLPKLLVLFLVAASLFAMLIAIRSIVDDDLKSHLMDIARGLIPEFLGGAAIYWVLDSSIQQLYGISEVPELPLADFMTNIVQARHVRILETFTSLIGDSHYDRFIRAITIALHHDAQIQILLIHPNSDGAKQRNDELSDILNVMDEIQMNLARLYTMQGELCQINSGGSLTVKLYNASPAIAMHQWDSNAYVSFYPVGQRADEAPNLRVSVKTTFGKFVTTKFDELWNQDGSILLKEHMLLTVLLEDGENRQTYAVQLLEHQSTAFYASCNFGDRFGDFMKARSADQARFQIIADGSLRSAICQRVTDPTLKQESINQLKAKYEWNDEKVHKEINLDPVVYLLELVD
jgi:hypothetical protein